MSIRASISIIGLAGLGLVVFTYGGARADDSGAHAIFAGGCFWCMEPPFEKLDGVSAVVSGYSGGPEEDPTYEEVSSGSTGHLEVVRVTYDPTVISYAELVEVFWRQIDPTDAGGQFADRGSQYKTARNRSPPRFFRPESSSPPRNIIRTSIRRIRVATIATRWARVEPAISKEPGAATGKPARRPVQTGGPSIWTHLRNLRQTSSRLA